MNKDEGDYFATVFSVIDLIIGPFFCCCYTRFLVTHNQVSSTRWLLLLLVFILEPALTEEQEFDRQMRRHLQKGSLCNQTFFSPSEMSCGCCRLIRLLNLTQSHVLQLQLNRSMSIIGQYQVKYRLRKENTISSEPLFSACPPPVSAFKWLLVSRLSSLVALQFRVTRRHVTETWPWTSAGTCARPSATTRSSTLRWGSSERSGLKIDMSPNQTTQLC